MSTAQEITRDIVVAMIQSGKFDPVKHKGEEAWNRSFIEVVKSAYTEIHAVVTTHAE